jgi:hypothetical protein
MSNIGKIVYPRDNSYSICLSTEEKYYKLETGAQLAGDYKTAPVAVKIVSEPFKVFVKSSIRPHEHEFVIVEHDRLQYMVLNHFSESQEQMLKEQEPAWRQEDYEDLALYEFEL